jgi:hypothetical protein
VFPNMSPPLRLMGRITKVVPTPAKNMRLFDAMAALPYLQRTNEMGLVSQPQEKQANGSKIAWRLDHWGLFREQHQKKQDKKSQG